MASTQHTNDAGAEQEDELQRPACIAAAHHTFSDDNMAVWSSNLSNTDDCAAVMRFVRKWGTTHPNVEDCTFHQCKMRAEGARLLARTVIPTFKHISIFYISHNPIGDEGVEELAVAFKEHCPRLEAVWFTHTNMTDTGFRSLCRNLPAITTILDVEQNEITAIPAELRRLDILDQLFCSANVWSDAWQPPYVQAVLHEEIRANTVAAMERSFEMPLPDDWDDDEPEVMIKPAALRAWIEESDDDEDQD